MRSDTTRVLMGFYFYPRGGSAHVTKAISHEIRRNGVDVTLLSGSRSDMGELGAAGRFFADPEVHAVDFTPALRSADPVRFSGPPGTAPMHASYEDREGVEDPVFAVLDDEAFETQVDAWRGELARAGAAQADLLYLHHLTPLNEAAARELRGKPVIGHLHGTELLLLERIAAGPPAHWVHAERWARRMRAWAAACRRIVVNSPAGLTRAAAILDLDPRRFVCVPNGFSRDFAPAPADRRELWREHLHDSPQGWRPGSPPGSVGYPKRQLEALEGTVLLAVGRFTEVKRLPLLIEAYAAARPRFSGPTSLVLLGGFPGEWEGEHPLEAIERHALSDVFLAGWHSHADLPDFFNAADLVVHASVREQFGQVLVEAMACGLPVVAVDRGGPAEIVDDGETGWLVPPDDAGALADAMVEAVNDPAGRLERGRAARGDAVDRYAWEPIGRSLAELVVASAAGRRIGDRRRASDSV